MEVDHVLAFRLARSGLAVRDARGLAEAAACPASDFVRDAALLALAARDRGAVEKAYDQAADAGDLVVAHIVRGAIHALAPADFALYGRALIARDDGELGVQLGRQVQRVTRGAQAARARGGDALVPWLPELPRPADAVALRDRGGRRPAGLRPPYVAASPGRTPPAADALRGFLRFYAPSTSGDFAEWAGLAKPHAQRLWDEFAGDLAEMRVGKRGAWLLSEDLGAQVAARRERHPPPAPGDPYLQKPNRPLLAADPELRKRLFRPVASPGAVLSDGRLAGLWRSKAKGRETEISVETLGRLPHGALEEEAQRVARLRGTVEAPLALG